MSIVSDIISQEFNIDKDIGSFANVLYTSAFYAFGVTKRVNNNRCKRKQTRPWYSSECEVSRRELKFANERYKYFRTDVFSKLVLGLIFFLSKDPLVPIYKKGDKIAP